MFTYFLAMLPLLSLLFAIGSAAAQNGIYHLDSSFSGSSFFDGFNFEAIEDPTHGFVTYVNSAQATALNLTYTSPNGPAYMGVDHTSVLSSSGPGRKSVRISSKKSWTHGLFIADIAHMPGGICGTWPAFWTLGPNWPNAGEIDIIEGVNSVASNTMSLHTSAGCTIPGTSQLGSSIGTDCDGNSNDNAGCGSTAAGSNTYGAGFNANGGGVYAMEWTSSHIRVWFFRRNNIPSDIVNGRPDPSDWGMPQANFQGDCKIDRHFKDHSIIFDTTFCGDWAGNTWNADDTCSDQASTCSGYVAANPRAFRDAYWSINSVEVYKLGPSIHSGPIPVESGDTTVSSNKIAVPTASKDLFPDLDATRPAFYESEPFLSLPSTILRGSSTKVPFLSNPTPPSRIQTSLAKQLHYALPTTRVSTKATAPSPNPVAIRPPSTAISQNLNSADVEISTYSNPDHLESFTHVGCRSSTVNFNSFTLVFESDTLTLGMCLVACSGHTYAGIHRNHCFCSISIQDTTTFHSSSCNYPCPGDPSQICGGGEKYTTEGIAGRDEDGMLFTLYKNADFAPGKKHLNEAGESPSDEGMPPPVPRPAASIPGNGFAQDTTAC
ncbi:uncharacterized protein BP5553_09162 [Venustampulla echinocandica]|uniref:endo-1,3(4)-beta-glucanase n=1 Tax=Venustampulla echinocandica TaxID=2656787 RepID=A0A370TBY0_9HELO|nr:uncharacterized protein BP5553_09162 [Venustampulla echinocandica]RDL31760.1 hypothetical protein BP5553_09162 [Venustampulla echinocandica]